MTLIEQIKKCRLRRKNEFSVIAVLAEQARLALKKANIDRIEAENEGRKYFFFKTKRGQLKYTRPIRQDLYIEDQRKVSEATLEIMQTNKTDLLINSITALNYTLVQDIASYLDIFFPTGSKKTLGTFFESLVAVLIHMVTGLEAVSGSIKVPGHVGKVSWDLCLNNKSAASLFIATKTSTRERLSQPFVQKLILSNALSKPCRAILVVVGDVQRVQSNKIKHTFTAGQFTLYSKFVEQLDGVYYMDIPPQAEKLVQDKILFPFENLVTDLPRIIK